jgi:hypothetical protein
VDFPAVRLGAMKTRWIGMLGMGLACVGGCKSAYVQADVKNATGEAIRLVEVDYPSASFGVETLAAGGTYHYRFKILGDGPTKILWTDAARKEHSVAGPKLLEGQQGPMTVTITGDGAVWDAALKP